MNRDQQMQGYERLKTLKVPERFKDYRIMLADLPKHPDYDVIYDMPLKTIWINTAAAPGANMARLETGRW